MRTAFLTVFAILLPQIVLAQGHGFCVDRTVRTHLLMFENLVPRISLTNLTAKTIQTTWTFQKTNNAVVAVNQVDVPTLELDTPANEKMSLNLDESAVIFYVQTRSSKTEYHIVFHKCVPNRIVAIDKRNGIPDQRSVFVVNAAYCSDFLERIRREPSYLANTHWRVLLEDSCKQLR